MCQGLPESGDKKTVVWIQRIHLQLTENKTNPVVPNWCPSSHDSVSHIPDENALCPTGPHGVFFFGAMAFFFLQEHAVSEQIKFDGHGKRM